MATAQIPKTMRALVLAKYGKPADYNIATVQTPEITKPDQLLIKVHAAAVNPIDVKLASGVGKFMDKPIFPYKLGYDLAGTVVQVGSAVSLFKPGDEIYSDIPSYHRGSIAQYALTLENLTAHKPASLSFVEAASIPLAGQTALQALSQAEREVPGGLKGKTVFIPAGLSGTGSFAIQLAKNVFGAGKVVTTLSTGKIGMIGELLAKGGPDQIVDYTKEDVVQKIGKGTVDFMFDTAGQTFAAAGVMKKGGVIVSISTVPNGGQIARGHPDSKWWLRSVLTFVDWVLRVVMSWKGIKYSYLFMEERREDLKRLAEYVADGSVKTVVGDVVKLSDVEGVRRGCQRIFDAKGGIGKFVVEID